ncbi:MAG: leucine-rich repeat protein [Clostridia bacterium]|nr:leucine-rich repeat protein [Clostridia bacterium]
MAIVTTNDKHYKDIADAIRNRAYTETPKQYKPSEMTEAVDAVFYAGREEGYSFGDADGYDRGRIEGEAAGIEQILEGKVTEVNSNTLTIIKESKFMNDKSITSINAPNLTTLEESALDGCNNLTSVNMPSLTSAGTYAFRYATNLPSVSFPMLNSIGSSAFRNCWKLTFADIGVPTTINTGTFNGSYILTAVIIRTSEVCSLASTGAFSSCYHILGTYNVTHNPTSAKDGYIYVPKALVDSYKTATNWVTFADQIRAIEDYPEITGG